MWPDLPLFPENASSVAGEVDALTLAWVAVSAFFIVLISLVILFFFMRYRRRRRGEVGETTELRTLPVEITWSVIPLIIALGMFAWGVKVFFVTARPPADAVEYWVTGKQWMWKVQHPEGVREINTLHVPVGQPVRLTMTSEDVIHSFFIPAFRVKADVLPGRYTTVWFKPTKPGRYHLFCAEYCGAEHSVMGGWVEVLEPEEYERWLETGQTGPTMRASGEELFQQLACNTCHLLDAPPTGVKPRAPSLMDLFGAQVALAGGRAVTADETYIRESIVNPQAKVVAGWQPIMPTFKGQVTEEQLNALVAYIKTLKAPDDVASETTGTDGAAGAATGG
jgi:cytochrome c oxidase subunit 2